MAPTGRSIAVLFYGGLLIGVVFFALGMAETVAIRASRLRRPILVMFGGLLVAEAVWRSSFSCELTIGAKVLVGYASRSSAMRTSSREVAAMLGTSTHSSA